LFAKDNGLAGGKGADKCADLEEFKASISNKNGIVVEDYIEGPEASHHAFCDGKTYLSMPFLFRDHKTIGEGDTGPMTGGMGVAGPLLNYTPSEVEALGETFVAPVVRELGFKGVLFAGLKGAKHDEKNLEWNARPGDPEMQAFMRLMQNDLMPIIMACIEGGLDKVESPEWLIGQSVINLVLVSEGYPNEPRLGAAIEGVEDANKVEGVQVLHAGTAQEGRQLVTNGGRVLNIVSMANSLQLAHDRAYEAASLIGFGGQSPLYRQDIGQTVLAGI
jgi:phosphoribosylamine--glycine ligase